MSWHCLPELAEEFSGARGGEVISRIARIWSKPKFTNGLPDLPGPSEPNELRAGVRLHPSRDSYILQMEIPHPLFVGATRKDIREGAALLVVSCIEDLEKIIYKESENGREKVQVAPAEKETK